VPASAIADSRGHAAVNMSRAAAHHTAHTGVPVLRQAASTALESSIAMVMDPGRRAPGDPAGTLGRTLELDIADEFAGSAAVDPHVEYRGPGTGSSPRG